MTKPATYPVEATMGQDGQLLVRHSESVTGSPHVTTELHAHYTEVPPKRSDKTLAERVNEAYKHKLEPKERELLDRAAEQTGRRLSGRE